MEYDSLKNDIITKIIDNNIDELKNLLENNPNGKEYIGDAMILFPMFGKIDMLKYLISIGLDIIEYNLLAECARNGNIELVEYILDILARENIQLEIYQEQLNKALHTGATSYKKSKIIPILKTLINYGAYFIKGEDTIISVCMDNNAQVLELFFKNNFNIMYKSAIEKAITHNCVDVIKFYLENGLLTSEIICIASKNDKHEIIKLASEYNKWFDYDKYLETKRLEKLKYVNEYIKRYTNYKPLKNYTINDSIEEIEHEYNRIIWNHGIDKIMTLFKPLIYEFIEFSKSKSQNIE
uniref:Ankyrin repeat protein n=1 Tax=Moumouvirus sp. 'Monve' TaxID=1128131 RepID=H2EDJ8_9VIRU|nr:hypothetical protein mv_L266 [Moumouvirus Monve]